MADLTIMLFWTRAIMMEQLLQLHMVVFFFHFLMVDQQQLKKRERGLLQLVWTFMAPPI